MAVWSRTDLSSVESNHGRFDAEYYKPEYLETENLLSRLEGVRLRTACSKIDVGHVGLMVRHLQITEFHCFRPRMYENSF